MLKRLFHVQTKSLGLASFILSAAYLASALLGIVRDRILASQFGAGRELDIYYAAFRIPDLVATVFIFGAITAAIIPIFSAKLVASESKAWSFTANLLNIFLFFLTPLCLVLALIAPFFMDIIAPGFSDYEKALAVPLLQIMFLSPVILGISNIISGILQVYKRFLITSLAPLMYNLGIIFGALFFVPRFGLIGLAWGVVLGAFAHLALQLPSFFASGFRFQARLDLADKGFLTVLKLMAPRSFGLMAGQINLIVITALASSAAPGAIFIFFLAFNLAGTATNLIAVSVATAVFPTLSLAFAKQEKLAFNENLSRVIRSVVFILTPLSVILFALKEPAIRVLFGTGNFNEENIRLTAICLGIFCFGILIQGLILVLLKAFYAIQDTLSPALISVATVFINYLASVSFLAFSQTATFKKLELLNGSAGSIIVLPAAFIAAALFQLAILAYMLYHKIGDFGFREIGRAFFKSLIASAFSIGAVYLTLGMFSGHWLWRSASALIIGAFVYLFISYLLKTSELKIILSLFNRRKH